MHPQFLFSLFARIRLLILHFLLKAEMRQACMEQALESKRLNLSSHLSEFDFMQNKGIWASLDGAVRIT